MRPATRRPTRVPSTSLLLPYVFLVLFLLWKCSARPGSAARRTWLLQHSLDELDQSTRRVEAARLSRAQVLHSAAKRTRLNPGLARELHDESLPCGQRGEVIETAPPLGSG